MAFTKPVTDNLGKIWYYVHLVFMDMQKICKIKKKILEEWKIFDELTDILGKNLQKKRVVACRFNFDRRTESATGGCEE